MTCCPLLVAYCGVPSHHPRAQVDAVRVALLASTSAYSEALRALRDALNAGLAGRRPVNSAALQLASEDHGRGLGGFVALLAEYRRLVRRDEGATVSVPELRAWIFPSLTEKANGLPWWIPAREEEEEARVEEDAADKDPQICELRRRFHRLFGYERSHVSKVLTPAAKELARHHVTISG